MTRTNEIRFLFPAWCWSMVTALVFAGACTASIHTDGQATGASTGGHATTTAGAGGGAGTSAGGVANGGSGGTVAAACGSDVGPAPWRRLTLLQYANTVRDLIAGRASTNQLAPDESIGPFHSNLVGATTDLIADEYMQQAESLASAAIGNLNALTSCDRTKMSDVACGDAFIASFGARAYRRPLTADETARYHALFTQYDAAPGSFSDGVRLVITTMLQSPNFLYVVETGTPDPTRPGVVTLGPYEIATRLSYFLWSSMPDAQLFADASSGALATADGLRAAITRMIADKKSRATLTEFHNQWLGTDTVASLWKDATVYPAFDALAASMANESPNFVDYVFHQGDGTLTTLLTSPMSVVADDLLAFYGGTRAAGKTAADPVMVPNRAGLLTQAGFLAAHASINSSSPVSRGAVVRRNVLCQELPDPPPNVKAIAPDPAPNTTTRQRFAQHEMDPTCASCHKLIDGIGLGFENYDGIGAFRAQESGMPIDATGTIVGTQSPLDGSFDGAVDLSRKLAGSDVVQSCVARQWFRFALGRMEGDADECLIQQATARFTSSGLDLRELLAALVENDAFRLRRPTSAGAMP